MRNKPLPGMMKHSPIKQTKGPVMPKNHSVTPPTEEQRKKSKGKFTNTGLIHFGTWDRPEIKRSFKREWGKCTELYRWKNFGETGYGSAITQRTRVLFLRLIRWQAYNHQQQ